MLTSLEGGVGMGYAAVIRLVEDHAHLGGSQCGSAEWQVYYSGQCTDSFTSKKFVL
jgi:hypothetical protein